MSMILSIWAIIEHRWGVWLEFRDLLYVTDLNAAKCLSKIVAAAPSDGHDSAPDQQYVPGMDNH